MLELKFASQRYNAIYYSLTSIMRIFFITDPWSERNNLLMNQKLFNHVTQRAIDGLNLIRFYFTSPPWHTQV